MKSKFFSAAVASTFLLSLTAWAQQDPEDKVERAGEKMERTGERAGEKIERAGQQAEKKAKQTKERAESELEEGKQKLSRADKEAVIDAAIGHLAEIELGKLAQKQGNSQAVKDYGEDLEKDHENANRSLEKALEGYGVMLPTRVDEEHQDKYDQLRAKKGNDFDSNFLTEMVNGHEKMIKLYKKQAKSEIRELKEHADETLPVLERHLKMAKDIKGMKAKTSAR